MTILELDNLQVGDVLVYESVDNINSDYAVVVDIKRTGNTRERMVQCSVIHGGTLKPGYLFYINPHYSGRFLKVGAT